MPHDDSGEPQQPRNRVYQMRQHDITMTTNEFGNVSSAYHSPTCWCMSWGYAIVDNFDSPKLHETQPMPIPGKEDVTEAVIADLIARNDIGVESYGTTLKTFNGRDALLDCYEELLDAIKYLKQRLMEEDGRNTN